MSIQVRMKRIGRHLKSPQSWARLWSHVTAYPRRVMISNRLKRQKTRRSAQKYNDTPIVAGILQHFNKAHNIPMLWSGLQAARFDELIVMDDGSVDGSANRWQKLLTSPNQFLIRSNDLFEVITYDRALRYSRADIVCLLQDDDKLPQDRRWVDRALDLFKEFPDLVILGGFRGADVLPRENVAVAAEMAMEFEGDVEGVRGLFRHRTFRSPAEVSPAGRSDFAFVMSVVRAPVFVRREAFIELGGFDLDFAPFLCDDVDNCLRAWRAGLQVGLYDVDFQRDIGLGGMRAFNSKRMAEQVRINWEKIYRKHGSVIASREVAAKVDAANAKIGSRVAGKP